MPIYDYACRSCGHRFEARQRFRDPPLNVCPRCEGAVDKLLLPPLGIHFKGSGWHITDYGRQSGSSKIEEKLESREPSAATEKTPEPAVV